MSTLTKSWLKLQHVHNFLCDVDGYFLYWEMVVCVLSFFVAHTFSVDVIGLIFHILETWPRLVYFSVQLMALN